VWRYRAERVSTYLGHGRSEDDDFVEFANPLHELVHARTLDDIDVVIVALDLHGYCEIGLVENLLRKNKSAASRSHNMERQNTHLEGAVN
jgi:hypothetical protein